MELLSFGLMVSEVDKKNIENDSNVISVEDGFLSLNILAKKFGYAKDHIGWLARTGRIKAIRFGNKGQWYANEDSVRSYHEASRNRFTESQSLNKGIPVFKSEP